VVVGVAVGIERVDGPLGEDGLLEGGPKSWPLDVLGEVGGLFLEEVPEIWVLDVLGEVGGLELLLGDVEPPKDIPKNWVLDATPGGVAGLAGYCDILVLMVCMVLMFIV